ncbi:hypothetical protein OAJ58_00665 [Nitrosopumilus sp.]|nr:hypothetical protein [Nitrosopumilus sp.]MDC0205047.1 hypothetical protein [Nitrosopumilus sp.]MDC0330442.1 hypothetical protein [Nitrosopumilus sp.]
MDKRDILVLISIMLGAGIPVSLMILVANGIIKLPLSNLGTN